MRLLPLVTFFLLFFCSILGAKEHQLIDTKLLYSQEVYSSFDMSSDGEKISYLQNEKDGQIVVTYDLANNHQNVVTTFAKDVRIVHQGYIAADVFHVITNNDKEYIGFKEDLVNDKFWKLNNKKVLSYYARSESHALFISEIGKDWCVEFTTPREAVKYLYNSNPNCILKADKENTKLIYDEQQDSFIMLTQEQNNLNVYSRTFHTTEWKKILEIDIDSKDVLKPIGFLDENRLLVLSNKETDKVSVYEYDIKTLKLGKILFSHPQYDIQSAFAKNGMLEHVEYIKNGTPFIHYIESENEIWQKEIDYFKDKLVSVIKKSKDNRKLLVYVESSSHPGSWHQVDLNTMKRTLLATARPDIKSIKLAKTTPLTVNAKDGVAIEALLTRPSSFDRNVLLVMPHGGPIGVRDYDSFNPQIQYFANRGFSSLRVNFRGSRGFGKSFQELGVGSLGEEIEGDIIAALNETRRLHEFDKICVVGASYGAYSAIVLAMHYPDLFDCVVSSYGIFDIPLLFNSSNLYQLATKKASVEAVIGPESEVKSKFSPVYHADKLKAPILIVAGKQDKIAYFEHSNRLKFVLQEYRKSVESLFFSQVAHGHRSYEGSRIEDVAILDFIERALDLAPRNISSEKNRKIYSDEKILIGDLLVSNRVSEQNIQRAKTLFELALSMENYEAAVSLFYLHNLKDKEWFDKDLALKYVSLAWDKRAKYSGFAYAKAMIEYSNSKNDILHAREILLSERREDASTYFESPLLFATCVAADSEEKARNCAAEFKKHIFSNEGSAEARRYLVLAMLSPYFEDAYKTILGDMVYKSFGLNEKEIDFSVNHKGYFYRVAPDEYNEPYTYKPFFPSNKFDSFTELYCGLQIDIDLPGFDSRINKTALLFSRRHYVNNILMEHKAGVRYGNTMNDWSFVSPIENHDKDQLHVIEVFDPSMKLLARTECKPFSFN